MFRSYRNLYVYRTTHVDISRAIYLGCALGGGQMISICPRRFLAWDQDPSKLRPKEETTLRGNAAFLGAVTLAVVASSSWAQRRVPS